MPTRPAQPAFVSSHPFEHERIGAAAIYCSDGRYGEQFDEFLHQGLGLPRYDRVAVPGGPGCLAGHLSAYRDEEALLPQLDFLVRSHGLDRIVLIAHEGCGFYLKRLGVSPDRLEERQREDMAKAAACLRRLGPTLAVEAFLARRRGDRVEFESVSLEPIPSPW